MSLHLPPFAILPDDGTAGALAGRVWRPGVGPAVVALRGDEVVDISATYPTMRDLCETENPAAALAAAKGETIGTLAAILEQSGLCRAMDEAPSFLSPIDLQTIKAAGVTFAISILERVIEEQTRGDPSKAASIRAEIGEIIGGQIEGLKPGSKEAEQLKALLIEKKLWSQYLEVGIGPDAEVFTKAPVLSSVGVGADVGLNPMSSWNNPEPEVVVISSSKGKIVGATLGNDVNLRDVEGRSALLLGRAKDNNASAAIGPFIRFFDGTFSLDDVRTMRVTLTVDGPDRFQLEGSSDMSAISRDPEDLVRQTIGPHHQYPDGFVLYCGTLFAPVQDRGAPGKGFTHVIGDVVTIRSSKLGALVNRVKLSTEARPWTFGLADLMRNLARRGLLS